MRRVWLHSVLIGVVACGGDDPRRKGPRVGDTDDTSVIDVLTTDTGESPVASTPPVLDPAVAAELEAAIARFAVEVVALDLAPVQHTVDVFDAHLEHPCPRVEPYPQGEGWLEFGCTTSAGDFFIGSLITVLWDFESRPEATIGDRLLDVWGADLSPGWTRIPAPPPLTATAWEAGCTLRSDDRDWSMSGDYYDLHLDWGGIAVDYLEVTGAVRDPDADPASWVGRGLRPSLLHVVLEGADGRRLRFVEGAIDELDVSHDTVWATDLVAGNTALGDPCPQEPHGLLAVRSPVGDWYDVVFDESACDGCGDVFLAGTHLGSVCPDVSPLIP